MPDNISLLPLPPYSPELNPAENVWQYLRQNQLSNRVFDTYDAIVDACCDAWSKLIAQPERITSIATRTWVPSKTIANGTAGLGPAACCDPTLAWDNFGNLFITYIDSGKSNIVTSVCAT